MQSENQKPAPGHRQARLSLRITLYSLARHCNAQAFDRRRHDCGHRKRQRSTGEEIRAESPLR